MKIQNACLTVIDMQNDFLFDRGFYAQRGHGMAPLKKLYQKLSASLLSLMQSYPTVFVVSEFTEKQFGADKSMCIKNTWGSEFALEHLFPKTIITKHEWSAFSSDAYKTYLKENNFSTIILMGVLTEWCIKHTALDGLQHKFDVIVVEDGIATGSDEEQNSIKTFNELKQKGVKFVTLHDLF